MGLKHSVRNPGFYHSVVVTEISPNYYAAGEAPTTYVLRGEYFDQIPSNAVGIKSYKNEDPLMYLHTVNAAIEYKIREMTDSTITLRVRNPEFVQTEPSYLGVIVSSDRNTIYWVNNSRPL